MVPFGASLIDRTKRVRQAISDGTTTSPGPWPCMTRSIASPDPNTCTIEPLHTYHANVAPVQIPLLPTYPHPFQCLQNAANQPSQQAQMHPLHHPPNAAQPQESNSNFPKATANPPPPPPLQRNLCPKMMTAMNLAQSGKTSSLRAQRPSLQTNRKETLSSRSTAAASNR